MVANPCGEPPPAYRLTAILLILKNFLTDSMTLAVHNGLQAKLVVQVRNWMLAIGLELICLAAPSPGGVFP